MIANKITIIIIIIIITIISYFLLVGSQYSPGSWGNINVHETDSRVARYFLPSRKSTRSTQPPVQQVKVLS